MAISDDDHHALIEPWLYDHVEASVRCVACGRSTLVGDLEGRWSFHIGELAVERVLLGDLPGGDSGTVASLNESRVAVGWATRGGSTRPYRWTP